MGVKEYPFYIKATVILIGLYYLVSILSLLSGILVPFAFAVLFSILLNPLYNRLLRFKLPRALAVFLTVLSGVAFMTLIGYLLSTQVTEFSQSFPILRVRFGQLTDNLEHWIRLKFGMSIQNQVLLLRKALDSSQAAIASVIGTLFGTLTLILIIPIYMFMLLLYKNLILNFLYEVFLEEHSRRVGEVLTQTKSAIQSYIVGLLIEMIIVSTLNSLALLIIGVKYAILLGILGGVINVLPYIGGFVSILLPVLIATVTKEGYSAQLAVIASYLLIQFVDSHLIFPRFVSIKVQINALISLLAVLLGGAMWGVAGMFLILPMIAILKIIFDRIDGLKPWGKLLGDEIPVRHMGQIWGLRGRKKKKDGTNVPLEAPIK
jgi:predicted PurR-regulated permease PerM